MACGNFLRYFIADRNACVTGFWISSASFKEIVPDAREYVMLGMYMEWYIVVASSVVK
jgi:hypothetical protein